MTKCLANQLTIREEGLTLVPDFWGPAHCGQESMAEHSSSHYGGQREGLYWPDFSFLSIWVLSLWDGAAVHSQRSSCPISYCSVEIPSQTHPSVF